LLEAQGVEFERRDYFRDRFTRDELAALLQRAGLTPREVLSTRSRAYKQLGLSNRDPSDNELLDLMVAEPTLLKRPIVISGDQHVVGFSKPQLEALVQG
jgi:Spx/MgsR family transcriptional regulator